MLFIAATLEIGGKAIHDTNNVLNINTGEFRVAVCTTR
jgi:hypothetical protein